MSKIDRFKKKHKNDPKPEKVVVPNVGEIVDIAPYGNGIVVDRSPGHYRAIFLDGMVREFEASK